MNTIQIQMRNKVVLLLALLCTVFYAQAQQTNTWKHEYDKLLLGKDSLQTQLKKCQLIKREYLQKLNQQDKQIKLVNQLELNSLKKDVDSLQIQVDSLNNHITWLNAKRDSLVKEGKKEVLVGVAKVYEQPFDTLIAILSPQSIERERHLLKGYESQLGAVFDDLETVIGAKKILAQKYDEASCKKALKQLSDIQRDSEELSKLIEYMENYNQSYIDELKKIIDDILKLDETESANGDSDIQKRKYNKIYKKLAIYMYNYYDYINYPFLSAIVNEIIDRKYADADDDISDVLKKLD